MYRIRLGCVNSPSAAGKRGNTESRFYHLAEYCTLGRVPRKALTLGIALLFLSVLTFCTHRVVACRRLNTN